MKRLSIVLLLALVIPALAAGNVIVNSGMNDMDGNRLPDGWVGQSLDTADRTVCHTQCWWRFSMAQGDRALVQTINTTLPTYTDIKLIYMVKASQIPLSASIEIDIINAGEVVEKAYVNISPISGKKVTMFRVAHSGDQILVKINTPGGLEWKIRGVKIKP